MKKKKKDNLTSLIKKSLLKKKLVYKKLKSQRATLNIPDKEVPSVLGDENRFFNREMEEVKKTMFFK